jgi:chemotaxis protein methyltransferase CheR
MLNEAEFAIIAREVKARSGAVLTPEIANAATLRLTPLARRESFATAPELIAAARIRPDGKLWNAIADALTQSETRFFRDRALFQRIREEVLPNVMRRRGQERIRIWSAACSTGQEPYSLAMIVEELRAEGGNLLVEIVASDFSERLIDKARTGLYTQFEVQRGLPIRKLIAHFERAGDLWRIHDRLRASVQFETANLLKNSAHLGQFDIVLLCHTLGSFDAPTRLDVAQRAADMLSPQGVLMLGAGEDFPAGVTGLNVQNGLAVRAGGARNAA